jgi:hypothetical protein
MDSQKTSRDEIRGHLVESIAPPQQNLINKTVKKMRPQIHDPGPDYRHGEDKHPV